MNFIQVTPKLPRSDGVSIGTGSDETNAAALYTRRQETLDDMTTVTGETFLGLTFELRALPRS